MQKLKLTNDFIFKKVFGKKGNEQLEYLTGDEAVRRMAFLREKAERDYVTNM